VPAPLWIDRDVVRQQQVLVAAEILFSSAGLEPTVADRDVFISYPHKDDLFINDLVRKLESIGVTCFKADRDVRFASDWVGAILSAVELIGRSLGKSNPT